MESHPPPLHFYLQPRNGITVAELQKQPALQRLSQLSPAIFEMLGVGPYPPQARDFTVVRFILQKLVASPAELFFNKFT